MPHQSKSGIEKLEVIQRCMQLDLLSQTMIIQLVLLVAILNHSTGQVWI